MRTPMTASPVCTLRMSIAKTAELAGCSVAHVKRVTALHRTKTAQVTPTA